MVLERIFLRIFLINKIRERPTKVKTLQNVVENHENIKLSKGACFQKLT